MSAKSLATVDVVVIAHLIRVNRDLIELKYVAIDAFEGHLLSEPCRKA